MGHVAEVSCGRFHACARLDDGSVTCWGDDTDGQLGRSDLVVRGDDPGEMGAALPRLDLGEKAVAISAGLLFSCAVFADGRATCWGANHAGQLGLGKADATVPTLGQPAIDLGTGAKVTHLSAGSNHTCATLAGGSAKCWGNNGIAQLGAEDSFDRGKNADEMGDALPVIKLGTGVTVKKVFAGIFHTCAVLDGGEVKCWGNNQFGQLGLGDTMVRGWQEGEMGDNLPPIDLGAGAKVSAVALSDSSTCALLDDGRVKCWGAGGRLGLGDLDSRGDKPGQMGDALPAVDLGEAATGLTSGVAHTCALLASGRIKCWGGNYIGQLGYGDTEQRGEQPGEMGDKLPYVDLGAGVTATAIAAGQDGTCALLTSKQVKCWGDNQFGQLGQGDTSPRGASPGTMGDSLPPIDLGD